MKRYCILFTLLSCIVLGTLAQNNAFSIDTISNQVYQRMLGKSYPANCPVDLSELRYLRVLHYDAQGKTHSGEIVCNHLIAEDLLDIFQQLYQAHYPIERMHLIDDYDADDERSMTANNTSCFCFRAIAGSQRLSKHARGLAIDINPLHNPCIKSRKDGSTLIQPKAGQKYTNRNKKTNYQIRKDDLCYQLFIAHGFSWGGNWRSSKDYQHFEK